MVYLFTEHKKRWLTGIGLVTLIGLIGWIDNFTLTWAFMGVVHMIAFYEAMRLFELESQSAYFWAGFIWIVAYFYPNPDDLFFVMAVIFGSTLAYFHNFDKRLLLPFLYPTSGLLYMLMLYHDYGLWAIMWLLVTVTLVDIGAFFVGTTLGKTPFSDTSPNKTWEGVLGGVFFGTAGGTLMGLYTIPILWIVLIITFFASVASIFGDLFESYLKREANIKDSGTILPGHGGVLDRIDGYLFAVVILVLLLRAFL